MQFPVIIHCTVKGRKSAHGHGKGAKASFPATLQGETLEKALQDASLLFPKKDGYKIQPMNDLTDLANQDAMEVEGDNSFSP